MATIYYELLFGNIPGRGKDDTQRMQDILKNGVLFPSVVRISEESRQFLLGCL
jgi:hypothetical protein